MAISASQSQCAKAFESCGEYTAMMEKRYKLAMGAAVLVLAIVALSYLCIDPTSHKTWTAIGITGACVLVAEGVLYFFYRQKLLSIFEEKMEYLLNWAKEYFLSCRAKKIKPEKIQTDWLVNLNYLEAHKKIGQTAGKLEGGDEQMAAFRNWFLNITTDELNITKSEEASTTSPPDQTIQ